jgi:hypothetical protein
MRAAVRSSSLTLAACLALCLLSGSVLAAFAALPVGWFKAGSNPADYDMGLDEGVRHQGGRSSATVKSIVAEPRGFGTLMQMSQPGEYRGRRVRLSGFVKSDKVNQWAGLWFRVDGPKNEVLAFDNMMSRAIKGTTEWARYEIVLDVPDTAVRLAFGILLAGRGQVWMDDLRFEVVPDTVKVTGSGMPELAAPSNLDFEK